MRAVVQRVSSARVSVLGRVVGQIDAGLLAMIGVTHSDTDRDCAELARRLHELRILPGDRSAAQEGAPILAVSQFTLYGDTSRGRRPSWSAAAPGAVAEPLFDAVIGELRRRGATVQTGKFGAHMAVELVNDGPVTVIVETSGR